MFNKILIANRGEIAVRIIRACKELNIKTVAIYSLADKDALHVKIADESICVGTHKSSDSYLNMENILSAAIATKSNAIHPGFGFLSENYTFAKMCKDCSIKFIGPRSSVINKMGNKSNARKTMIEADVPVIPGSAGILKDWTEAKTFADEYGYPVIIKASAGGGGKGIRIVHEESNLQSSFENAQNESLLAFNDGSLYIEKVIVNARHIEVQILGDEHGNVVHLFERDCSLQRNSQKVLEEAPAYILDDKTRMEICNTAVKAGLHVGYYSAGTIEFLYDNKGNFYFMEMNTRIQVEHPITEMITGIDIVKEQINIAFGNKLSFTQDDVKILGHSIECRINAENPDDNFKPMAGTIDFIHYNSGCIGYRFDSAVYSGYSIPPFYDSMIAKVITFGKTREDAIIKMNLALDELTIDGLCTNISFQKQILQNNDFINCNYDIQFIERGLIC